MTVLLDQLFEAACAVRAQAYAPYSGFAVGAALCTDEGRVYAGVNVENAAYPVGTCAEAGAIAAMVADGGRAIRTLVVVADSRTPVAPCGACRQRIGEFMPPDGEVHAGDPAGLRTHWTMAALLPDAFGPNHLHTASRGERP